ncbi:MAG: hypothetical protein FJW20_17845 [Acidimicrobiia bacterium]|nr:hypothetical protein [Acidimicrobiia bacterium]
MQGTTHESYVHKEEVQSSSERSFGFVFTVVMTVIGLWPLRYGGELRWWSMAAAGAFLLAALVYPAVLRPLNKLWFRFGLLLSRITNPIVLAVMFYLLFTPMGWLCRVLGKNLLGLRADKEQQSYWITREPGPAPETMRNQF